VIKFKENLKNIKISLIAPIFNEIQHLDACLKNISNQFIKYELDIEFIIIDDCSTDGTYEKLKSLESDKIKIFRTSKNSGGAGEPRNIGLQNACGQYVVFYDFGDVIDFSRLTEICSLMEHNNSNIAVANHVDIHPDQEIIKNPLNIYKDSPYLTSLKETPQLIHNPFSWGKVYNLKWLREKNIKFGLQYCGEDKILTWNSYLNESRIIIHPHILYGHKFFGAKINRMLQRDFKLIESIISIDAEIYHEFSSRSLEYIYAKRVLHRDLLGIILKEDSISMLKESLVYEKSIKELNNWLQRIIPERIEFFAVLDMSQRKKLEIIFGGIFSSGIEEDKSFYNSDRYNDVLKNDFVVTDPSIKDNFVIALHLPQFHPDASNDRNWGKGFTEWTNVTKSLPLYKGHVQPKLPTDQGFYDLRLSESRIEQMKLAKFHGIDAFCYYHYWFSGKTVLETTLKLMLENKNENFPFMLCWANETWTGIWHGSPNHILIKQEYPGEQDYIKYFNHLLPFFKDERYLKIKNKPLFSVWQPTEIPDSELFIKVFNDLALDNGFDGVHMIGMAHWHKNIDPIDIGYDRSIPLFMPPRQKANGAAPTIYNFELIYDKFLPKKFNEKYYPCITPNWDNTPRSGINGMVFENNHPGLFARQLKDAIDWSKGKTTEKIFFIKAWNEWAEGNFLEPDRRWGRSYLSVLKNILGL